MPLPGPPTTDRVNASPSGSLQASVTATGWPNGRRYGCGAARRAAGWAAGERRDDVGLRAGGVDERSVGADRDAPSRAAHADGGAHSPPSPASATQPAVPASCVSAPLAASMSKTAIASEASAPTYSVAPSGDMPSPTGSPRPTPSAHCPPEPLSLTQPAVPVFWVSVPSAARSKVATEAPVEFAA